MALNQGFYNLGAALLLLVFYGIDNAAGVIGMLLFLFAMGVVGGVTANWRIIVLQSLPALAAVLLHVVTHALGEGAVGVAEVIAAAEMGDVAAIGRPQRMPVEDPG